MGRCWKLSFGDKKALYGKARVAVGGASVDDDGGEEEEVDESNTSAIIPMAIDPSGHLHIPKNRSNDNMEPVAFWSLPIPFYREVYSSYCCRGIYDLAAG